MYEYNLQFDQVPPSVYTGFYNQTPFYISLTTTDPNFSDLKVKFFSQNSKSSPYQIPQNKWSHLVPQWKFVNSKGEFIEYETPYFVSSSVLSVTSYFLEVTAYYIDDLPSTVNLIATLETSGFSFESDHPEAELLGYSNSLIFDDVEYQILEPKIEKIKITQDGKNPIDKFKWTDTFVPFTVTLHPSASLATNIYGLTSVDPIIFAIPNVGDNIYLNLSVYNIPNSSVIWNDASSVMLSTYDDYGFVNGGYYRGHFTPLVSSIPSCIIGSIDTLDGLVPPLTQDGIELDIGPPAGIIPKITNAVTGFTYNLSATNNILDGFFYLTSVEAVADGDLLFYDTFLDLSNAVNDIGLLDDPLFFTTSGDIKYVVSLYSNKSNKFQIKKFERPYEMRRFNESWDAGDNIHSYALAEHTYLNPVFFDNFMEVAVGGLESNYQSIGRTMYERIANFVRNHNDIDVSNVNQFYSILQSIDVPYDDYELSYPSEMERLVDILSIHKTRLLGEFCKCNRNFFGEIEFCRFCGHRHSLNRTLFPQNNDEFIVSAGVPFVVENVFSKNENYKFDIVFASPEDLNFQPSAVINTLPSVSWMTSSVYYKYSFYNYISSYCDVQEEGVINWNDTYTTLSSSISSLEDWYGNEKLVEEMLNYEIHRGLYNA